MATTAPELGQLTTVTFGTSAFAGKYMSVEVDTWKRGEIKTSHLGTSGWDTFIPTSLKDAGTITLKLQFDSTEATHATRGYDIVGTGAYAGGAISESIVIDWGNQSASVWTFAGFCTGIQTTAEIDTLHEVTFTFKCTSSVTIGA
jgi:hypothetical protein